MISRASAKLIHPLCAKNRLRFVRKAKFNVTLLDIVTFYCQKSPKRYNHKGLIYLDRYLLKLKHYDNCIQYTYTNVDYNKRYQNKLMTKKHSSSAEVSRCSISRSISKIKDYCLCNKFEYFFTLTLKTKRRNDVLFSTNLINCAIARYAKRRKHFKYLYVFEKQKKGGIHLHGFFSGFDDLYINKYGHLSSKFFDKIGFQCFIDFDNCNPFYIIKYISKEPIKELKRRYFASKNLNKPDISYLHCNFDEFSNFGFTFSNQYCKMITIAK